MKSYVIAGSHREYLNFIQEWQLQRQSVLYLSRPEQLHGILKPIVYLYGTYYTKDTTELEQCARDRQATLIYIEDYNEIPKEYLDCSRSIS